MRTWTVAIVFSILGACSILSNSGLSDTRDAIGIPDASRYLVCKESNVTNGRKLSLMMVNGSYRMAVRNQWGQDWASEAEATRDGDIITFTSTQGKSQAKYSTTMQSVAVFFEADQSSFLADCTVHAAQPVAQGVKFPGDEDYYVCMSERFPQSAVTFVKYQGEYGLFGSSSGQASDFIPFQIFYLNPDTVIYNGKQGSQTENMVFHLYINSMQYKMFTKNGEIRDSGSCQRFLLSQ